MKSMLANRLQLRFPLIQAPMAGVSTAAMAAAATNAGALGSIAVGALTASRARETMQEARALLIQPDLPLCINMFCHRPAQPDPARDQHWIHHLMPYFREFEGTPTLPLKEIYQSFNSDTDMQAWLIGARPAAASFHFGLPAPDVVSALKAAGIFTMATATCINEARQIEAAGLDAIVAQGVEAGGHRGVFDPATNNDQHTGTFALVRLLACYTRVPIIAAGGIMDGQGIAAALALGADAVQLGTAFLLTEESAASPAYRAALTSHAAWNTRLTRAISGRPARGIVNRFISDIDTPHQPGQPIPVPSDYPLAYDAGKQLHALASRHGCHDFAAFWAGQGAALARTGSTAQIIAQLMAEFESVQSTMAGH